MDPELERLLQDLKRLRNGVDALQDRVIAYIVSHTNVLGSPTRQPLGISVNVDGETIASAFNDQLYRGLALTVSTPNGGSSHQQ